MSHLELWEAAVPQWSPLRSFYAQTANQNFFLRAKYQTLSLVERLILNGLFLGLCDCSCPVQKYRISLTAANPKNYTSTLWTWLPNIIWNFSNIWPSILFRLTFVLILNVRMVCREMSCCLWNTCAIVRYYVPTEVCYVILPIWKASRIIG